MIYETDYKKAWYDLIHEVTMMGTRSTDPQYLNVLLAMIRVKTDNTEEVYDLP